MYMDDAVRATIELMEAPGSDISVRTAYNLAGISFTPAEIAREIKRLIPGFNIEYGTSISVRTLQTAGRNPLTTHIATRDWRWKPSFKPESNDAGGNDPKHISPGLAVSTRR